MVNSSISGHPEFSKVFGLKTQDDKKLLQSSNTSAIFNFTSVFNGDQPLKEKLSIKGSLHF